MKTSISLSVLLSIFLWFTGFSAGAVNSRTHVAEHPTPSVSESGTMDTRPAHRATVEAAPPTKPTFKERITFGILKRERKAGGASPADERVRTDGMALAGFIMGAVGLFVFGFILGTLAVVFGIAAMKRIKKESPTKQGYGLAVAALVIGIVAVVGWAVVVVLLAPM